jgi:hypothetical protein
MEGNEIVIIGRCYRGNIRKGDVFVHLRSIDGTHGTPVHLSVNRLTAYRRDLNEIDEGLTAELCLSGQSGDLVQKDTVLSTE